jgi:hypothetical protein
MICGLPKCKKPVDKYGVCAFHKAWYFLTDDVEFNEHLAEYKQTMMDLELENKRLKSNDIDIMAIQECWNNNMDGPRIHEFPPNLILAGNLMEKMDRLLKEMQLKYDKQLVFNCTIRARHQCGTLCTCLLCKLKSKIK